MPDVLATLLANPGLYVGTQSAPDGDLHGGQGGPSVARITVSVLPGNAGVSMDYEVLDATNGVVHAEHALLGNAVGPAGPALRLITAHSHADVITSIIETEPGTFPADPPNSPFPMKIRLSCPEAGQLVYEWSYGYDGPGGEMKVRDVGTVKRVAE